MWIAFGLAGLEAVAVLGWIISFARTDGLKSVHSQWYVELPLIFLALPAIAAFVSYGVRSWPKNRGDGVNLSMALLLILNFVVMVAYAAISGGGV